MPIATSMSYLRAGSVQRPGDRLAQLLHRDLVLDGDLLKGGVQQLGLGVLEQELLALIRSHAPLGQIDGTWENVFVVGIV